MRGYDKDRIILVSAVGGASFRALSTLFASQVPDFADLRLICKRSPTLGASHNGFNVHEDGEVF